MNDMREAALSYARRGWHVLPLHSAIDGRCSCGKADCASPAKHPRTRKGANDASDDERQILAWWSKWPAANIGLATGPSGLVVLDVDGPEGLAQLKALGETPRTLVGVTGRAGGFHLVYAGTGIPASQRKGEHLDVRGSTGYIVAPPSIHANGRQYQWIEAPVAPVPAWVGPWVASRGREGPTGKLGNPVGPTALQGSRDGQRQVSVSAGANQATSSDIGAVGTLPRLAARASASIRASETPAFSIDEARRLRSALAAIPADIDGKTWFSFGAALHDLHWYYNGLDIGFEIWDEWSKTSQGKGAGNGEYKGRADLEKRWLKFQEKSKGNGYSGTTIASIFSAAFAAGWRATPPSQVGQDQSASPNMQHASPNMQHASGKVQYANGHNHLADAAVPKDSGSQESGAHPGLPLAFVQAARAVPIIWPDRDKWGNPKPTCRNARVAIRESRIVTEYDSFHDRFWLGGHMIGNAAGLMEFGTESSILMLRDTIEREHGFDPGTAHTYDAAIQECLGHSRDPVVAYLNSLQWDGRPRLDQWLVTYMSAPDSAFNRAVGALALIAAVRRARKPGTKFDQVTVLIGPEGKGKSRALEVLAGSDNFSDQEILTLTEQRQQEALQGVWIYEIGELAGLNRAETEKVKSFLSRTVDRCRPAYGRKRTDAPRRNIFFGTTNHETFLESQTGNRRYWPIQTGAIDVDGLQRDRDQIWAEAAVKEKSGCSILLPEALWSDAAREQDARMDHHPWEDVLAGVTGRNADHDGKAYLDDLAKPEFRVMTGDLFACLHIPAEKQTIAHAKRIAFIMRKLGWDGPKKYKIGQITQRGYARRA